MRERGRGREGERERGKKIGERRGDEREGGRERGERHSEEER
jgi:hypothetical protein